MEKPTILYELEMREKFAELVNEYSSKVPAMHMIPFFNDLVTQLKTASAQQIAQVKAEWEKEQEKLEKED